MLNISDPRSLLVGLVIFSLHPNVVLGHQVRTYNPPATDTHYWAVVALRNKYNMGDLEWDLPRAQERLAKAEKERNRQKRLGDDAFNSERNRAGMNPKSYLTRPVHNSAEQAATKELEEATAEEARLAQRFEENNGKFQKELVRVNELGYMPSDLGEESQPLVWGPQEQEKKKGFINIANPIGAITKGLGKVANMCLFRNRGGCSSSTASPGSGRNYQKRGGSRKSTCERAGSLLRRSTSRLMSNMGSIGGRTNQKRITTAPLQVGDRVYISGLPHGVFRDSFEGARAEILSKIQGGKKFTVEIAGESDFIGHQPIVDVGNLILIRDQGIV